MHTVTSRDGTRIAYWRSGRSDGPSLLLIHGATADHSTTWRRVLPLLEPHLTVYVMDRRGRGQSGDTAPYDLQRESEDVAAVVTAIGGPVNVLGHSYGAHSALDAALLTSQVQSLILYEGIALRGADYYPPGLIERLEALLAAGDVEEMLVALLGEVAGMSAADVEVMRQQRDAWAVRLRNAPATPRELRAERARVFTPERYAQLRVPTLLLVGGDSEPRELDNARAVAAALRDARIVVLPGQGHIAMTTAPEAFAAAILEFLRP